MNCAPRARWLDLRLLALCLCMALLGWVTGCGRGSKGPPTDQAASGKDKDKEKQERWVAGAGAATIGGTGAANKDMSKGRIEPVSGLGGAEEARRDALKKAADGKLQIIQETPSAQESYDRIFDNPYHLALKEPLGRGQK